VDVLVNNAGIQHVSPIEDFPVENWDAVIAINLSSAFHAIRAVTPGMKQRGWGRIINTASAHSLVASPFKSAYVAAKHGIAGLTKTVALELAQSPITCNCISPGYVWTPLVEKQIPETMEARNMSENQVIKDVLLAAQPTKEFVTVEQVASLALFLCSDDAAQITGANLSVDGGWTAARRIPNILARGEMAVGLLVPGSRRIPGSVPDFWLTCQKSSLGATST
jgi:3-hydroxybutyrate dehydrogenase